MCTSIAWHHGSFYFCRNLDLEVGFGQQVVITPRNLPFTFRKAGEMKQHYAMIGMATMMAGQPLYAEAVNEKGLGMAGLNFPGNAYYPPEEAAGKDNIAPFELIWWLLGQCASVAEVREKLGRLHVIGIPFSDKVPNSPLHWHIADKQESIVVECMRDGMHIHENPVGVLTNNPPFDFHMYNLAQYTDLTAAEPVDARAAMAGLKPFGRGFGAIGLPGDATPTSRFVRAAFLLHNSMPEDSEAGRVGQFLHLLDGVAMTRGSVLTDKSEPDFTLYSCCINGDTGVYYYKTYGNNRITAVDMHKADLDGCEAVVYPLRGGQDICFEN